MSLLNSTNLLTSRYIVFFLRRANTTLVYKRNMFSLQNMFLWMSARSRMVPIGNLGKTRSATTLTDPGAFTEMVKSVIPPLTFDKHKGQAGRVATIGGSSSYTGAPFFSAMSALRLGCDLSIVFCTPDSSVAIKSYSPEIIVHPFLNTSNGLEQITSMLNKFHATIIGPGLGRDDSLLPTIKSIINKCRDLDMPLVIDADGVFFVSQDPDMIKNYNKAILTPNVVEFKHLFQNVVGEDPNPDEPIHDVMVLARALGNVTIVRKGLNDIIADGNKILVCCGEGSPRRCGGQGDILSGTMGTFTCWANMVFSKESQVQNTMLQTYGPNICAAYGACLLTRQCAKQAFAQMGRQMTTTDMMAELHRAFVYLYE
ncbi:ATP-dependent (S)-NAD(P)H-hydrate dehydratase-like [Saccoglossus kowalevskii]|uniref:ATP-dependent (S)-NAD(P)H-hydrate dehydratase n=1 Tax=Saccoglossus kowalevskii TaxID=10224 RepID=A0ABM0H0B9_SACKO|nr:PREDICTED: ATP-dependent (S)-NAD(P)H-hydrate dehydratase-like [Saccoglossus kowalevskii]